MLWAIFTVAVGILIYKFLRCCCNCRNAAASIEDDPGYADGWFGRGEKDGEEDTTVYPFTINVKEDVLSDLKRRLENTRVAEPIEDVKFTYGFNPDYLKKFVEYWRKEYDWRKHEADLNKYPHFTTKIEGIDVHFMHIVPDTEGKNLRVIPIMIVHGWPGCFAEFYKIVPLLTTPSTNHDFVFEVICPSIPGYGFSEAAHKPGLTSRATGRIFTKLMDRIGHRKFYLQGGDWGSNVVTNMSRFYPNRILGVHLNMCTFGLSTWCDVFKYLLIAMFPMLVSKEEYRMVYPIRRKFRMARREMAYFYIQATKPDTLGCALSDSPAGLAAYLLEKFSVATNHDNVKKEDGGLTEKFTLDELITNCMIYWVTNSFPSAARFYKENSVDTLKFEKYPVQVPAGAAVFPNEILMYPRTLMKTQFPKLISYSIMSKGGHFAAMEEPKLLADDVWKFVALAEKSHSNDN